MGLLMIALIWGFIYGAHTSGQNQYEQELEDRSQLEAIQQWNRKKRKGTYNIDSNTKRPD